MPESNSKTGYLKEACRLFHLCGLPERSVAYHYHDFHKLLYLMEGEIGYEVEGISYRLEPGDLMLVGAGSLHRPIFDHTESYERLIFYLSPSLMLRSPWTVSRGKGFEEIINAGSGILCRVFRNAVAQAAIYTVPPEQLPASCKGWCKNSSRTISGRIPML